jgi:hypothetical protein
LDWRLAKTIPLEKWEATMTKYTVAVPTCRPREDIQSLLANIRGAEPYLGDRLIASCLIGESASVNRNWCLDRCETDVIVMVDDDVSGFPRLFAHELVETLLANQDHAMVSAKLLDKNGEMFMGGNIPNDPTGLSISRDHWLPTACVAMYAHRRKFDEGLPMGEDVDYCWQRKNDFPKSLFVVANEILVRHANEEKWRTGDNFQQAMEMIQVKWGRRP